ncbi:MAG TPA: hypothetical protein VNO21_13960 [Polyangiaceae bacterium]|nr:hypothetical protein [Polyangiaceae bacterium]
MSWIVLWSFPAEHQLRNIPSWKNAERVAKAVYRFAATGEGEIERVPDHHLEFRLLVVPFVVRFSLDLGAHNLCVWAIYRR